MELGLSPLKESAYLQSLLVTFSTKPWLGMLAGAVFTAIVQSSSATTSLVVAMARQGLMTFSAAVPLVLGANVGTTVTALLASIGTKLSARRTAVAHLLFNLIGVILIYPFLVTGIYQNAVISISQVFDDVSLPRLIANSHTLFNVVWALFWAFQVNNFAKLVKWLVKGEEKISQSPSICTQTCCLLLL